MMGHRKRLWVITLAMAALIACDEEKNISIHDGSGCGIRADGTGVCWGTGSNYNLTPPAGVQFDAIGATQEFACGLLPNQSIRCWGAGNATRVGPYTGMATGRLHVCGQKADRIECWSYVAGVAGLTISGEFDGIAMGDNDLVCGIRTSDRAVECYDISASSSGWSGPWIESPYGVDFGQVSAGGAVCGLRTDSRVQCFSGLSATAPTFNDFREIATGANFACAIRSTGAVVCWGDNSDGQLNVPSGTYVELTAFSEGICGVRTNGTVTCWGRSVFGNLSPPPGVVLRLNEEE